MDRAMKNRIGVILLALVCIGLAFGLLLTYRQSTARQQEAAATIGNLSNQVVLTTTSLEETRQVAATLEKDLDKQRQVSNELTNSLSRVSANLAQTSSALETTKTTLQTTQEELKKRDTRISELENQNQVLDKQALNLSTSLTNLTAQITETQRKLAASEGDKAFLEKELKRMMAEKAELERQFNDLAVLRAQVAKLKEELSIARRIEWIRQGLFASTDQKGAQKLMQGVSPAARPAKAPNPAYDLNVEVNADGSVRVIPPGAATNPPAPANPAPR
jgi:chromosome segregation ATPase